MVCGGTCRACDVDAQSVIDEPLWQLVPDQLDIDYTVDYFPQSSRRSALTCILLCQFFSWSSFNAIILWIPQTATLSSNQSNKTLHPNTVHHNDESDDVVNIMNVVLYMAAVIAGVAMDAWIRKTPVMLIGVLVASAGIIGNATFTLVLETNEHLQHHTTDYFTEFVAVLIVIAIMEAFISVALPTLGGDQIPRAESNNVRLFYAVFYWCQKLGEAISYGIYIYVLYFYLNDDKLSIGWPVTIFVSALLSVVAALLVACCNWSRQVGADCSAITYPFKIWKQAFERRSMREPDQSFLSSAQLSSGGSYPDRLVTDMDKVFKFIVILLCLLPVMLAVKIPGVQKSCYHSNISSLSPNRTPAHLQNASRLMLYPDPDTIIAPLINSSTSLIAIPLIHVLCIWMSSTRYPVTLLHRFAAGHLVAIIGNIVSILYLELGGCHLDNLIIPPFLGGLCKAFIYTAGYELTLLSAPRSMQGTAMGLFYFIDGISSLIYRQISNFNVLTASTDNFLEEYAVGGVAASVIGLTLLIVLKYKLGLSSH